MSPTRTSFKQELNNLRHDMIYMGDEIQNILELTLDVIIDNDVDKALVVINGDDEIDEMEIAIQRQCVLLIAKEQPLAKDLRLIMSIIKIVTDMERIADQCEEICRYCLKLNDNHHTETDAFKRHVNQMALAIDKMLRKTLDSFRSKDVEAMLAVCEYDDNIDARFANIWQEIIAEMKADNEFIPLGPHYIMIIKYLERIADHTTNIAEWMIYNITGEYTM
ncbi:MAG: hypothetical protein ATN34_02815 [Epulopiscium sp. Nele67-Bin002]|nr:MAG: hypothetical protein ATN34_02815 [Epulopiscium sp. Nele67-Bin002]OON92182.1 MAG: phosphate transport system regulatory protein PhoU [Epulopiscium sp. Nele67-Bin001]